MRFTLSTSRSRSVRRAPLIALAAGLMTSVLAGPPAAAEPDGPTSAELAEVHAAVDRTDVDGIAWYTDRADAMVVVTTDSTVSAAERGRIQDAAGAHPGSLTIKRADGVFRPLMGPGDRIYGSDIFCSLGFNVHTKRADYFLTAGHCGNDVRTWHSNKAETVPIGPTVDSRYPGDDYALVRYESTHQRPGGYSPGDASVGQKVTRIGSTTGKHTGTVQALDVSVRYEGGVTLRGMIEADICVEPGDSGGPLYAGSTALGLTSGGSGDCPSGGTSFYQPVTEALRAHGVELN